MTVERRLLDALDGAGHRLTGPRRALVALIAGRRGPFTAADLEADAQERDLGIGRATVFRSLDLLAALGVVERIDLPTGEHAWVACATAHHHHLVCSTCGRTTDVEDADLGRLIEAIGERTGYAIDTHRLELFGRCATCQAADIRSPGAAGSRAARG
jgi:Fur family ferric uptake transcriptional regulator